jgi:hypothetical protein
MFLRVFQSLEIGSPNPRITDAHLRGYDRCQPGWIAGRIGCLVAAVEIVRILRDRQSAFEQFAYADLTISETSPQTPRNETNAIAETKMLKEFQSWDLT